MQEMQEMLVQSLAHSLVREDALEEEVATHSSILACKIPWTRSLEGYSPWGHEDSFELGLHAPLN